MENFQVATSLHPQAGKVTHIHCDGKDTSESPMCRFCNDTIFADWRCPCETMPRREQQTAPHHQLLTKPTNMKLIQSATAAIAANHPISPKQFAFFNQINPVSLSVTVPLPQST